MKDRRIFFGLRLACMAALMWPAARGFSQVQSTPTTQPTTKASRTPPNLNLMNQIIQARSRHGKTPVQTVPSSIGRPAAATRPVASESFPIPTTLPAGEKAIQFCFDNAPYSTVFNFIERISGLPIMGDRNIQGTVMYFSRKKMTLNEALDELNLILEEKDRVVVRVDDHLVIDKYPDVLRQGVKDFVDADRFLASEVPSNQVVRVFMQVKNLPAEELVNLLSEALPVNHVKPAAWKTVNQIQLVGLASQIKKTIGFARQLDRELKITNEGQGTKVFKPKYISPSTLERMLRSVLPPTGMGVVAVGNSQLGEPGGARGGSFRSSDGGYQIASDDVTGTLVVRGNPAQLEQVNRIVQSLDVQEESGNLKAVRVSLQYAPVSAIQMALNEGIKQRASAGAGGRAQTISIQGDEASRSVVLLGLRPLVEQAEQMIKLLDQPTDISKVEVISLTSARADAIFRDVLSPYYRGARGGPPAAADPFSNSIITWATGSELEQIRNIVKQLDEQARQGLGVPEVRTYRLDSVNVDMLRNSLQQAFSRPNQPPTITFGSDPITKTLIVAASPGDFKRIEKVINEFKAGAADRAPVTRVFNLKYANADQVANAVRGSSRPMPNEPGLMVSTNPQANSVIVNGSRKDVEEAEKLVGKLDDQIRVTSEIKTFKLNFAQSDDVAKMIQELYGAKDPTLKVVSDSWTNTLFVSGGSGNVSAIERLIKTTDNPEPTEQVSSNVVFITLKTASADEAADQIDSMLSSTGGKNLPTIEAATTGNYLIVTGQPKQIERVRQLAEQIDKMAQQVPEMLAIRPIQKLAVEKLSQMLNAIVPQRTGTRVRIIPLNLAQSGAGLESLMAAGPTTQPGQGVVTIGVDRTNNTLVIRGRPKEIEEIDKTIEMLTTDMPEDVQFRTYTLKFASPTDVALSLESLFNETVGGMVQPGQPQPQAQQHAQGQPPQGPGAAQTRQARQQQPQAARPGAARRIRTVPIDQTNSLVVRADPRDFQTIEEFIAEVDREDTSNVQIYKLKYARADAVAKTLTELFRGSTSGGGRRWRASGGQPGMMGMMAGQTGNEFNISADMSSNSVIVTAGRSRTREIEAIIETMDKPESAGLDVRIVTLKSGKAEQIAPMIQQLLQQAETAFAAQRQLTPQPVAVSFDRRTNSLIVAGTERQFTMVKSLVDRLETVRPATGERRIFVVPLRNLDPNQAKQILDQLLPRGGQSRLDSPHVPPSLNDAIAAFFWTLPFATMSPPPGPPDAPSLSDSDIQSIGKRILEMNRRYAATTRPARHNRLMQTTQPSRLTISGSTTKAPTGAAPAPTRRFAKTIETGVSAEVAGKRPTTTGPAAASPRELEALAGQVQGTVDITAVPEQNALIIDASESDYRVVQQILDVLDLARPTAKVEVFKLQNARAQELAEVVGRLFANRPVPRGMPAITITPDTATNSVIVSAVPDMLQEIGGVIRQLDSGERPPPIDFRIFTLKNARASQIVPQIQKMIDQILASQGGAKAPINITADDRTNTIVVTAPTTYLDQIGKIITTLDSVPTFATVELDVVRLVQSDVEIMAKVLDTLVDPTVKRGPGTETLTRLMTSLERVGQKGTLDLEKPIKFITDKASQTILLLSTAENNRILRQIIQMFDKVPLAADLRVRVFPLKMADAADVRKSLEDIFSKGRELTVFERAPLQGRVGAPENPTGEAVVYKVNFSADKASNTLIAAGHEQSLALVEVLIGQLDQELPGILNPVRTIGLKHADGGKLSKLIQDVMDARMTRAKALGYTRLSDRGKPIIRVDDRVNVLLVSAPPEDFQSIQDLVKKLDVPPEDSPAPTIITLKVVEAETMSKMLLEFFKARNEIKAAPATTQAAFPAKMPVIIPDPRSNTLIVSAGKTVMKEINDLVDRLDNFKVTRKVQVAIIPLHSADASQLAEAIMKVLNPSKEQIGLKQAVILEFISKTPEGKMLAQQAIKDQLFIYGDKTSNLLMAVAPAETVKMIESLVAYIDQVAPTVEIRIFALENADATQMKKTIEEIFAINKTESNNRYVYFLQNTGPEKGSKLEKEVLGVTADTRTNSLLVSGSPTYLKMIEKVIKDLDAKPIQQQQTEVIPLKYADAETIQSAISTLAENRLKMWKEVYGQEGVAPERLLEQQVNIVADNDTRKMILQASPKYFKEVMRIIQDLDQAPPQVMIQTMILEVTLDGRIEYGFEAVGQDLSFTKNQTAPGIGPGHDVVVGSDLGAAGSGVGGFTFSLRSEDFNLLLRALNTDGKLRVLSRPQILARDNAKAEIQIGQNVPIPQGSNISQETGNTTTSIDYKDVGVILRVTPHISSEGFVTMEVNPEISSVSSSNIQISENLTAPILNKNTINTMVSIKDGETVVIGGLITNSRDHRETKVPFFGDIPLLGLAFKSLTDVERNSEILVVITPKIIDTVEKARSMSEYERDQLRMLPREYRESELMGRLQQTFDEDGFPITTQPVATQPGPNGEIEVPTGTRLFDKPRFNEQLFRGFDRTSDQE